MNMANSTVLVQVDVKMWGNPLQHLPQGVGIRVDRCLRASTGTLPGCLLLATAPGTVLVKGLL